MQSKTFLLRAQGNGSLIPMYRQTNQRMGPFNVQYSEKICPHQAQHQQVYLDVLTLTVSHPAPCLPYLSPSPSIIVHQKGHTATPDHCNRLSSSEEPKGQSLHDDCVVIKAEQAARLVLLMPCYILHHWAPHGHR